VLRSASWVADITYLRTGEGWLYLAAVQDTYSRQIVGWSMATHIRTTLVVDALRMNNHNPECHANRGRSSLPRRGATVIRPTFYIASSWNASR
jgi:transposase InsO family protein